MPKTGYGYCECGCGQKTTIAKSTERSKGWVKGEPKRFVRGHATKRIGPAPTCSEDGCNNPVRARSLCAKHWQQWDRARDPERYREYNRTFNERNRERRLEQARARYAEDPQKHIDYSRRHALKRKYGLTLEEWEAIIAKGCAICGVHLPAGPGGLALDHCHTTGRNRDALCTNCNTALGSLKDDPALLVGAIEYLKRHAVA